MERNELEKLRRQLELQLANEPMGVDEKTRILLKLLDFVETEIEIGND